MKIINNEKKNNEKNGINMKNNNEMWKMIIMKIIMWRNDKAKMTNAIIMKERRKWWNER